MPHAANIVAADAQAAVHDAVKLLGANSWARCLQGGFGSLPELFVGARSISPFPETLDRLQQLIPHAQRIALPNASHMMNIDNQPAFLDALEGFLDQ